MSHAFRSGLIAPAGVAVATLVTWAAAGAAWALAVLAAGALAIIGIHLWHIHLVTEWARGPLDALPPEGRGVWADVCSAIYRRTRLRSAYQRDLQLTIDRFRKAAAATPSSSARGASSSTPPAASSGRIPARRRNSASIWIAIAASRSST